MLNQNYLSLISNSVGDFMDRELVKTVIDTWREFYRISGILPTLPPPLTPLHVHIIDHIHYLAENGTPARASILSEELSIALPGITRAVNVLEKHGFLRRRQDPADRRAFNLELTKRGNAFYDFYVGTVLGEIAEAWSDISEQDANTMIRVMLRMGHELAALQKEHPPVSFEASLYGLPRKTAKTAQGNTETASPENAGEAPLGNAAE
jgi:MarR family transcriptional regulator for hemolysin